MKIPFNIAAYTGVEDGYVLQAMHSRKLSGDRMFTNKCQNWFEENLRCIKTILTPSCTHALEMAAILINIKEGDEVIMPSFTFVSTANAFVIRGAKIVFVDIRPDTMNIDEEKIENAITKKTRAIVPVHYAGVACDMDVIMELASKYSLYVIEDAAQAMMSTYKGKKLGTIGHFGTYSFHETKNYTSGGEGGLLLINDESFVERAEIVRDKGTNRKEFLRGSLEKYSWVDIGSSYLMNEISAAYLWGNLKSAKEINDKRLQSWEKYAEGLKPLASKGYIEVPSIPDYCSHNAHIFYIKVKNNDERNKLLKHLDSKSVCAVFHYTPLHSALAGSVYSYFNGKDEYTTREAERLIRLPIFYGLEERDVSYVIKVLKQYFINQVPIW